MTPPDALTEAVARAMEPAWWSDFPEYRAAEHERERVRQHARAALTVVAEHLLSPEAVRLAVDGWFRHYPTSTNNSCDRMEAALTAALAHTIAPEAQEDTPA